MNKILSRAEVRKLPISEVIGVGSKCYNLVAFYNSLVVTRFTVYADSINDIPSTLSSHFHAEIRLSSLSRHHWLVESNISLSAFYYLVE